MREYIIAMLLTTFFLIPVLLMNVAKADLFEPNQQLIVDFVCTEEVAVDKLIAASKTSDDDFFTVWLALRDIGICRTFGQPATVKVKEYITTFVDPFDITIDVYSVKSISGNTFYIFAAPAPIHKGIAI